MLSLESALTFMAVSTLLSLAPGPDNLFVLTQSAMYGKKPGILVTLGLCTGLTVHTTAVALGIAAIFQTSVMAFSVLKTAGAIYLAYLAWQAFRASAGVRDTSIATCQSSGALYRRGIIMNITNPKVSIFFLAFLPQFTSPEHGSIVFQLFLLGGLFICVALIIFCAIAVLAGSLGRWLNQSPKAQIYLNRIAGMIFLGLALKLAFSSAGH